MEANGLGDDGVGNDHDRNLGCEGLPVFNLLGRYVGTFNLNEMSARLAVLFSFYASYLARACKDILVHVLYTEGRKAFSGLEEDLVRDFAVRSGFVRRLGLGFTIFFRFHHSTTFFHPLCTTRKAISIGCMYEGLYF